ncbi:hypothetical protein ACFOD9_02135 [Novosphingobium bradum]|uniref:Uncharacterized protein n=1 Tax=Novosphingobium bradum TaxID=1737444 RepID=A0ABV7IK19_9SPHN
MLLTLPRLLLARLIGAALLLAVALQAGMPFAAPLQRTHGSAFSATTHEVALASQRRGEVVRLAIAPEPRLPALVPAAPLVAALAALPAPRPRSTGPPAREDIARRPSPRAPPTA